MQWTHCLVFWLILRWHLDLSPFHSFSGVRIDLMAYLFGDILAVSRVDLVVIWGGAALVVALISWRWSALLTSTHERGFGPCKAGSTPNANNWVLTLALAHYGCLCDQGGWRFTLSRQCLSYQLQPRGPPYRKHPEGMAFVAGIIGALSAVIGLRAAYVFDTPAGPSIVCVAAFTFLATSVFKGFRFFRIKW